MYSPQCGTLREVHRVTEKRRGRKEIEVTRRKGGVKRRETDLASNQFPKCFPEPRTPKEIHTVGYRREGGGRRYRSGGEKGESKGGESNQVSNHTPK